MSDLLAARSPIAVSKIRGVTLAGGVSATTKINRKDFGPTWNAALQAGGFLVGDEVTITVDVEAVKGG